MKIRLCTGLGIVAAAVSLSAARPIQAAVATFDITGLDWHNTTYVGNVSSPRVMDFIGTGEFTWTYTPGNFAGGTGSLVSLQLPPWSIYPSGYPISTIVDSNGISSTLAGNTNVDNLIYDYALNFSPALTNLGQTVNINGGSYQFGIVTYQFITGEFDGTFSGGTVSPAAIPEPASLSLLGAAVLMTGFRQRQRNAAR